jgi:hypothetical protein
MFYYRNLFSLLNKLIYGDHEPFFKIALDNILKRLKSVTNYINLLILIVTFLSLYYHRELLFIIALNYTLIKFKSIINYISLLKINI